MDGECTCVQGWGEKDCLNKNWITEYDASILNPTHNSPASAKYLASIYFAVVAFSTVGFGDITPTNDAERLCALFMALVGAIVFAYCVGSISSLAAEGSTTEAAIDSALRQAHDFLTFRVVVDKHTEQMVKKHVLNAAKAAPHLLQPSWGDLIPRRQRWHILYKVMEENDGLAIIPYANNAYACV